MYPTNFQMGYELARFVSASASGSGAAGTPISVDEELVCPICSGVLQEPVHTPQCEHAFCKECIHNWIDRKPSCPIDRSAITIQEVRLIKLAKTLSASVANIAKCHGYVLFHSFFVHIYLLTCIHSL